MEKKILFQTFSTLSKSESMADKGYKLIFHTQELDAEQATMLAKAVRNYGYLAFILGDQQIDAQSLDVPEIPKDFSDDKSPSKRLRDRMWVYYTQTRGKGTTGFQAWYIEQLERIGQQYLDKTN